MKTALELLKGARETLTPPENWTKHTSARGADGSPTAPSSPQAVCWCLEGAVLRALGGSYQNGDFQRAAETLSQVAGNRFPGRIGDEEDNAATEMHVCFNDHRDTVHEEVLGVLDKAIAIREERDGHS